MKFSSIIKFSFFALCNILPLSIIYAQQKLPNKQFISLRTPKNVRVDGLASEWNDNFQAYNSSTEVFYTMANSNESLYLIVHATDENVVNKILKGGFTLSIKANISDNVSITFPFGDNNNTTNFSWKSFTANPPSNTVDSIVTLNNKILQQNYKLISVKGPKGLDTLMSIYNDSGIKVAQLFDNKKAYTFELSLDLKIIGLTSVNEPSFSYQLKINGWKPTPITNYSTTNGQPLPPESVADVLASLNAKLAIRSAATDFESTYKLKKDPND